MINQETVKGIIGESLQESSLFITGVVVKAGNKIMVHIDGDHYVTVDDCAYILKLIESKLDREKEDFELLVSSPGADQLLTLPRQFPKHAGKKLEIVRTNGEMIVGVLLQATPNTITLAPELKKGAKGVILQPIEISHNDIGKAKCIISLK